MFEIRPFESKDAAVVWALHNRALNAVGAHAGDGPWDEDLHDVERTYLDTGSEFLVATIDGKVVGMGALVPHSDGTGEIKRMRVEPDQQGQGIGKALLNHLEAAAAKRGITRLFLDTTEQQTVARHLYESNDYVEEGRHQHGKFVVIKYGKGLSS